MKRRLHLRKAKAKAQQSAVEHVTPGSLQEVGQVQEVGQRDRLILGRQDGAAKGLSVFACLCGCDRKFIGALLFQVCPVSPMTGFRSL